MNYHRYVLTSSDGSSLHGNYRVNHIWQNEDGTSLFRVECSDANWQTLNSDSSIVVMPSLDAPADRLSAPVKAYFDAQFVTAAAGDTLINMLRKVRSNDPNRAHVLIDKPH